MSTPLIRVIDFLVTITNENGNLTKNGSTTYNNDGPCVLLVRVDVVSGLYGEGSDHSTRGADGTHFNIG